MKLLGMNKIQALIYFVSLKLDKVKSSTKNRVASQVPIGYTQSLLDRPLPLIIIIGVVLMS